jgi:hypothetical protein
MRNSMQKTKSQLIKWGVLSLLSIAMMGFIACGEEKRERPDVVKDIPSSSADQSAQNQNPGNASTDLNTNTNSNPSGDVQHYICPNDCEGSGGPAQGSCPVCGTAYVHNQAFHNQGNQTPQNQINLEGQDQLQNLQQSQQNNAPAQKNGEYHYVCSAGCSGGSGSAGTCSQCGASLEHNTAYHN